MRKLLIFLLLVEIVAACGTGPGKAFTKREAISTNIYFNNEVIENDSVNPIDLEFLYNGGGVAAGDFNNDGLTDLYFTASTVGNKLYLNKGKFEFADVTEIAKVSGDGMWSNGASVVDINSDGLQDIYVCMAIKKDPNRRRNLLYVNQGKNKDSIPVFKELANEYGIADTGYSVQGTFFDYDNDGDLDLYVVETKLIQRNVAELSGRNPGDSARADADKLYRNDWSASLKHPVFTDVSSQAGIKEPGYGLGVNIADINNDGWKDIYVTNDFYDGDLLYINNRNGTFTNKSDIYFKHTSQNAMGNDVADVNGDGLNDIIAVDMNPEDNYRKKKNMSGNNYYVYQTMMAGENSFQYVRNTLQINMGPRILGNDSTGDPVFADLGYFAGVAETDWSWNPSIADFDNDGNRDVFITNGYPRDVTDHDFVSFRTMAGKIASKQTLLDEIPQIRVSNYAYQQTGDLKFVNKTKEWGLDEPSFSNGAIYADLDNDGDLDYVVNNINQEAFVYENRLYDAAKENDTASSDFIKIKFRGNHGNRDGLGAIATIFFGNKQLSWENSPVRGYLSCVENILLFGLPDSATIDSVVVTWPGGNRQTLVNVNKNQTLVVTQQDAIPAAHVPSAPQGLFTDVTDLLNVTYHHSEKDFIDFNYQRLLPHKFSEYGPGIAIGDVDNNGYEDICLGGTGNLPTTLLMQQPNGKYVRRPLIADKTVTPNASETTGLLLFDADTDGDLDLYLASGSVEAAPGDKYYDDRFYENTGKGVFRYANEVLPLNNASKSCVKAADFDKDGDLDLFVGVRVFPGRYPQAVSSYLYRNDSKPGHIKFSDISNASAPGLKNIGLSCDAMFTDFDNDGWTDLIVAGEWSAIRFFRNQQGIFKDISSSTGTDKFRGWWNSITGGDFDNDSDIDYVAGNLGTNTFYRGTMEEPLRIYAGDFANNGGWVAIPSIYLFDSTGIKREFAAQSRNDIIDQLPALKKKYLTYRSFAGAELRNMFPPGVIDSAYTLEAGFMQSAYIENQGNGKFLMRPLPWQAQLAPVFGIVADDFNGDGHLDLALAGNDFGAEPAIGRYDALNGLIMNGDGKGNFKVLTMAESGIYIPGNAKALAKIRGSNKDYFLVGSQNQDRLKLYRKRKSGKLIPLNGDDTEVKLTLKNGRKRKMENYAGSSFQSQSSSFVEINEHVSAIEIKNRKGETRRIDF
ncbi:VCBS repeat-containing protein [Flavitalea antarctica]